MTGPLTTAAAPGPATVTIADPVDLQRVMGTDFQVSPQQWSAISAPLEPAVVIAGAGSGKTALMAARVVYLVVTGQVAADQVLGLTFTTKAASELGRRIRDSLAAAGHGRGSLAPERDADEEVLEPTVATYNAYAAALLTEHGLRIGHEPDTRVMADASRYQLAVRAIARHTGKVELLSDHPETVVNYLLGLEGAMSEHLVDDATVRDFQRREVAAFEAALETARAKADLVKALNTLGRRDELLDLVRTYRRLKADLGLMDFSDQIALAARLADEHPDVGRLEREKYRIVLLDEYQDTSVAQARMLRRLFSGADERGGRGHAVTAVGDPNQAIYGWRGASVSNILGFGHDFPSAGGSPDVPTYPLTVNRRSDRRILEVANRLAAPLYAQFPQVRELEAADRAAEGAVRAIVHETYAAELAWLADEVAATHAAMPEPAWREIGVLTRDNASAADVFDALSAAEIPVEIVGLQGLLRLPEVAEVVATLTLLHDLTANAALLTLLTGPRWAIGPRDLALLGRRARRLAVDADAPGHAGHRRAARGRRRGGRPDRGQLAVRRARRPGGGPLLRRRPRAVRAALRGAADAADARRRAAARPGPQDHRHHRDRRRAGLVGQPGRPGPTRQPRPVREGGGGVPGHRRRRQPGRAAGLPHRRGRDGHRPRHRHPERGRLGQAAHRAPRQGPGVGRGVLRRGLRGEVPDHPHPHPVAGRPRRTALPAARGRRRPAAAARPREGRPRRAARGGPDPRGPGGAAAGLRRVHPRRGTCWSSRPTSGPSPARPRSGPRPTRSPSRRRSPTGGSSPTGGRRSPRRARRTRSSWVRPRRPWPVTEHTAEALRRIDAAEVVRAAMVEHAEGSVREPELDMVDASVVAEWDAELDRLLVEARRDRSDRVAVPLPSSLSATAVARLRDDPADFARDLARPMPRQPSPSARFGTRFHAWVEARFGQQDLFDPEELPGQGDRGIDSESDLAALIATFESGPFAERLPVAVEAPFALVLAGQVVRGRIDAVYADGDDFLVVDWKTNQRATADPLQLGLYRQAWAELRGIPPERVRAAFYYVRTGEVVEPDGLPGREEIEALLAGR